jgi:hypothetical protein
MPSHIAHALFWVCAAVCAVGQGALLWTAVRRQERGQRTYNDDRRTGERRVQERWSADRRADALTSGGDTRLRELAWVFLPAVALALLLAATWSALP